MLKLVWLYPTQLNLYGDRGNVECLMRRLEWRGIKHRLVEFHPGDSLKSIKDGDLFFAGGGPDSLQRIVSLDAFRIKSALKGAMEAGKPGLFICGFYQLLGKFYRPATGPDIKGLGLFDCYTQHFGNRKKRCVGNIQTRRVGSPKTQRVVSLVGFENHEGRTYLGNSAKPFAKVKYGFGNNSEDKTEGLVRRNFVGTYLHGPILPKNPHLADWLLEKAVGKRLKPLDDELEWKAHKRALKRK
jgi:CobQ-like glutamine amidotransferase family enzyme